MTMVRSMKYPNRMEIGICSRCSALKFLRRMTSWIRISRRLNAIVNCPSVKGKFRMSTYGIDEIGDVPRFAFVIRLTPSELMKSPIRNTM